MTKNINFKSTIGHSFFNKILYSRDKAKLKTIVKKILLSLNSQKDIFYLFSKSFKFNFKYSEILKFNKYKSIILIGMGGSALGVEAIYSICKNRIKKNFIFFDDLDQSKIEKVKKNVDLKKSLFIIISKSGNTLETLININLLEDKISSKNTIIITENSQNLLNKFAKKKKILIVEHKNYIGGRYSVLSEVGMIPAYFMGLKIEFFRKNLLSLFKSKRINFLIDNVIKLSHIYKIKKINSIILLNYTPEVNNFLYWFQQLIAESLGKKGKGIIPIVSPAPKDHHSLMQLYLDGPKDKLFYIFNLKLNRKMKINLSAFEKKIYHC